MSDLTRYVQCREWIELVYADPKLRQPGESWSVRCTRTTEEDNHLHKANVQWLAHSLTPPDK